MDDERADLADRLLVVVGNFMEDHVELAISIAVDAEDRCARIAKLEAATHRMTALVTAAKVLGEIGG